ncbi:hypothetical protein [Methanogenium cariaci]|uniref:hypothetical protein n=1 Tax=Methanogenium cariaci TaxID=2197 RepID=UPI00078344B9|nr:hypothetical protein [Methanogenium cariaci]
MMVIIDIYIDSRSDAGLAMNILKDALITSKYVYVSPPHAHIRFFCRTIRSTGEFVARHMSMISDPSLSSGQR